MGVVVTTRKGGSRASKNAKTTQVGSQFEVNKTQLVIVSSNSTDRHVFLLESLTTIKENKKW